eukprot:CAMPEP_0181330298 /NCGR_PEP_ID=MMETSP1101-20121128/23817_1 /TAXON_ID=46948 /ORGANISM="Rhodomonas abbreviata, Strain Caron Lab Isolate" /LENGTH=122 /DNA_ID=CAMNT_0023439529 /DNA_START=104 /DNA_END=468 /DNA_ORIENTATION=+
MISELSFEEEQSGTRGLRQVEQQCAIAESNQAMALKKHTSELVPISRLMLTRLALHGGHLRKEGQLQLRPINAVSISKQLDPNVTIPLAMIVSFCPHPFWGANLPQCPPVDQAVVTDIKEPC